MDGGIEAGMGMEMRIGTGMGMGIRMGIGIDPAPCGLLMHPCSIPALYKPGEAPCPTRLITAPHTAGAES